MQKVIDLLERQLRFQELVIADNKMERQTRKVFSGYKGPALHQEDQEYIKQLKKAITILQKEQQV